MSNIQITNVDTGNVLYKNGEFQDDTYDAGAAGTLAEGTILGRKTSDGKLGLFNKAGSDGLDTPVAVMTESKTIAASGDFPVRTAITGVFRLERLVIADGDPTIGKPTIDLLKRNGLTPVTVQELSVLDNQ